MLIALRLTRVVIHLLIGFSAALAFGRLPERARGACLRWWARGLLTALGIRIRVEGQRGLRAPTFVVANHVSWLDVIALVATEPALFVCKSEIAGWPGIGWLLKRTGTIFIRRDSFRDVWRVNMELRARFDARQSVAAFPEGTTTMGNELLVFRPALFQPAVERGLPVQPVSIAYSSTAAAYVGETSFLESLLAVCAAHRLEVRLALHPPLASGLTRRQAAGQARGVICGRLAQGVLVQEVDRGPFKSRLPCSAAAAFSCTSRATPGSASPPGRHGQRGT